MSAADLLDPTGPQRGMRSAHKPTVYRPAPGAHPHHLRRESDGVYGWVRMDPVEASEPPNQSGRSDQPDQPDQPHQTGGADQPAEQDEPAQPTRSSRSGRSGGPDRSPRADQRPQPPAQARSDQNGPAAERPHTIHDMEGYDQRPDPLLAETPAQFVQAMRDFRTWSGDWSFRQLEEFSGGTPRSTFHAALKGDQLPKLPLVGLFITACGGDEAEVRRWTTAWRRLRMAAESPCRTETTEEAVHRLTTDD